MALRWFVDATSRERARRDVRHTRSHGQAAHATDLAA
jgi:hypothetical protein